MDYRPSRLANVLYGVRALAWPGALAAVVLWTEWAWVVKSIHRSADERSDRKREMKTGDVIRWGLISLVLAALFAIINMFLYSRSEAWLMRFGEIHHDVDVREVIGRVGTPRRTIRSDSDLQSQADGIGFVCSDSMETDQIPRDKADPRRYLHPMTGARQPLPQIHHEVLFYYLPFRHGIFIYLSNNERVERVLFCFE